MLAQSIRAHHRGRTIKTDEDKRKKIYTYGLALGP